MDYYLDGQRATVFNHFGEAGVNVTTEVFTGNNVGAVDYWATKCEGVEITTNWLSDGELGVNKWGYLGSIDTGDEYSSLVRCLPAHAPSRPFHRRLRLHAHRLSPISVVCATPSRSTAPSMLPSDASMSMAKEDMGFFLSSKPSLGARCAGM